MFCKLVVLTCVAAYLWLPVSALIYYLTKSSRKLIIMIYIQIHFWFFIYMAAIITGQALPQKANLASPACTEFIFIAWLGIVFGYLMGNKTYEKSKSDEQTRAKVRKAVGQIIGLSVGMYVGTIIIAPTIALLSHENPYKFFHFGLNFMNHPSLILSFVGFVLGRKWANKSPIFDTQNHAE